MARILLNDACLTFHVRPTSHLTWKDLLLKGLFTSQKEPIRQIPALRNISIEVHRGERLGILGHNGAGKSTLLKVLAGIYPLTRGTRIIEGRISSLFDLSLGFEPEATGWENIRYRGYLQGETPDSLDQKMSAIAELSELGEHLNIPVRFYSTGMLVRLAFSIATAIEPEILLIDEILSAGDLQFQQKARRRIHELIEQAQLIVMVSHDLKALENMCDQIIWLKEGQIHRQGFSHEIVEEYIRTSRTPAKTSGKGTQRVEFTASV